MDEFRLSFMLQFVFKLNIYQELFSTKVLCVKYIKCTCKVQVVSGLSSC